MMDKLARAVRLDELKSGTFYRDLAVEFFGTFFLLFIVGGLNAPFDGKHPSIVQVGLAAGLGVGLIVWGTASTSGGHINPAISLAVCLAGHITIVRGVGYSIAQCAGAYLAILLTQSLTPAELIGDYYGVTRLNPLLSPLQGCVMEIMMTFFLAFTIYAFVDKERSDLNPCGPLMIGLSVTMTHMFGVPYTGCSVNPARSFGPALATGYWQDHWIYWVGPILGSILAIFSYDYAIRSDASLQKLKSTLFCSPPVSNADGRGEENKGIQMNDEAKTDDAQTLTV